MASRKKILILIEWFTPGYKAGGPIQSCVNLCIALKDRYDLYILTTNTDHGESIPYDEVTTNQWNYQDNVGAMVYYAEKNIPFKQLGEQVTLIAADFVYLNLLFSPRFVLYPLWLKYRNKINCPVIVCPRGTLYDSAVSLKSYKKKPLLILLRWMGIQKKIIFHATNEREEKAIHQYFPKSNVLIADNLPDILQPPFISCPKTTGSLHCIFIARIVAIKNLLFLIQLMGEVQQTITLTIVGPVEEADYWATCKKAIAQLPQRIQINYTGPKKNDQLAALLQQHHLFVLPTTGENFGHAIFEALRAGRPVLISDQTPWLNLTQFNAGWSLPLNKKQAFISVLEKAAAWNQQEFNGHAEAAWNYANNFINNPTLIQPYLQLFS